MTDLATLQTRLTDAEDAYHQLMLGKKMVMFRDSNGEQVQYNQMGATGLLKYIRTLQLQIESLTGASSGPIQVWMGH